MSRSVLFVAALLCQSVWAGNDTSKLFIHSPASLKKENGYEHREALFGLPPYGGSIVGNVYYVQDTLCDRASSLDSLNVLSNAPDSTPPHIFMVDRGGCTFVQKVRKAQRLGAAAVVVADNTCLCSDAACLDATKDTSATCESQEPILADDGSGNDVSIPSFLMFKVDADKVKEELKAGNPVKMEMSWKEEQPASHVVYELYTTPTDFVSRDFLHNFGAFAAALGDKATFVPHMYTYDGVKSNCRGQSGENFCYNLCTNNGRYCATDPDNDLDKGTTGAQVVAEGLRRMCIWKQYGEKDGVGTPWWKYVNEFDVRCSGPDLFNDTECIQDAYNHASVDKDLIDACILDSGGLEDDTPNALLDAEIESQTSQGVVVIPSLFVAKSAIRGELSAQAAFLAICAGFGSDSKPDICKECSDCGYDLENCIANQKCVPPKPHVPAEKPVVDKNTPPPPQGDMFEDLLSSDTISQFLGGLGECGIDVGEIMGAAAGLGASDGLPSSQQDLSGLASLDLFQVSPTCSADDLEDMRKAFESFKGCAGYDMLELEETWPSALLGAIEKCARSFVDTAKSMDVADLASGGFDLEDVPEECSTALLGNNPLGTTIRRLLLHPDEVLPCFQVVSEAIPKCSLDVWPIPIDGGWLKLGSCVIDKTNPLLEGFCNITLTALDSCLPLQSDSWDCDKVTSSCTDAAGGLLGIFFDLPSSLMGLPLPDTCARVGNSDPTSTALDRYEKFRAKCANGGPLWTAWEKGDSEPVQSYLDALAGVESQPDSLESSSDSRGGSGKPFLSGLATGLCLAGLVSLSVFMMRKTWADKTKGGAKAKYSPVVPEEGEMA